MVGSLPIGAGVLRRMSSGRTRRSALPPSCLWPQADGLLGWTPNGTAPARFRFVLCPSGREAPDDGPAGGHGGPRSRGAGLVWRVPLVIRRVGPRTRTRSKFGLDRWESFAASRAWGVFRSMRLLSPPPVPSLPVRRHDVAVPLGAHQAGASHGNWLSAGVGWELRPPGELLGGLHWPDPARGSHALYQPQHQRQSRRP